MSTAADRDGDGGFRPMTAERPLRVVLVHPPAASTPSLRAEEAVPPLGLAYVAAAARRAGHAVSVVDAVGEALDRFSVFDARRRIILRGLPLEEITARIPEDADVIGVSCMFSGAWRPNRTLVEHLKRARPRARIVLGGEHVTACSEYILETCASVDFCVLGEGEETFCRLLAAIADGALAAPPPGVAARGCADPAAAALAGVPPTQRRLRMPDIHAIAEPAWDLFPLGRYLDGGYAHGVTRGRTMPILASRGCPYQCTFCSSPNMWTTKWTARRPHDVLDEMKGYRQRYGAEDFAFYDLTAIVDRRWIVEFCELVIRDGLRITWQLPSGTRSEAIDAEVAGLLYRAGCRNLDYAPESGAPTVLRRIKKRVDLDRMVASIRDAVGAGLEVKVNFIIGFPDESPAEVRQTIALAARVARLGVEAVGVFAFCPYPGSELFDELRARGRIRLDDAYFDAMVATDAARVVSYNPRLSAGELVAWSIVARAAFYGLQLVTHPARVVRLASEMVRGARTSKTAKGFEAMRMRRRAWRVLAGNPPSAPRRPRATREFPTAAG